MSYLLDTHAILWYFQDDKNLSPNARHLIDSEQCYFSYASLWEIAIKQSLGKLNYSKSIPAIFEELLKEGFLPLEITVESMEKIKELPFIHKDPFDRILISQVMLNNLVLITKDEYIPQYDIKTVW